MTTITITPESLGRPLTADDVQEGDVIRFNIRGADFSLSRTVLPGDSIGSLVTITSISREVADVPEPEQLLSVPTISTEQVKIMFVGRHEQHYLPFDILRAAMFDAWLTAHDAAICEAALDSAAFLIEEQLSNVSAGSSEWYRLHDFAEAVRAFVPVAGEKKA